MILMGHGVTKFQKQKNSVCRYGNLGPKNLEFCHLLHKDMTYLRLKESPL